MQRKRGRPSKYRKRFCKELVDYFDVEAFTFYTARSQTIKKKNGEIIVKEEKKPIANPLPAIFRFCDKIGINTDTFSEWVKRHPDFSVAFTRAQELRKQHLITLGLTGVSPPASFIFVSTNLTDMRPAGVGDLPMSSVIVPIIVRRGDDRPVVETTTAPVQMIPVSVKYLEHAEEVKTPSV